MSNSIGRTVNSMPMNIGFVSCHADAITRIVETKVYSVTICDTRQKCLSPFDAIVSDMALSLYSPLVFTTLQHSSSFPTNPQHVTINIKWNQTHGIDISTNMGSLYTGISGSLMSCVLNP